MRAGLARVLYAGARFRASETHRALHDDMAATVAAGTDISAPTAGGAVIARV